MLSVLQHASIPANNDFGRDTTVSLLRTGSHTYEIIVDKHGAGTTCDNQEIEKYDFEGYCIDVLASREEILSGVFNKKVQEVQTQEAFKVTPKEWKNIPKSFRDTMVKAAKCGKTLEDWTKQLLK